MRASSPFGDIVKSRRATGTREEDAKAVGRGEKGQLAMISHKFSFPPRKPRDTAKRENCHYKRVAD